MEKKRIQKNKKKNGGALDHNKRCASNREYEDGSCLSLNELKAIAIAYNNALSDKKFKGEDKIDLYDNITKKDLIIEIDKIFKKCNGDQLCWLKQKIIDQDEDFIIEDFFRPYGTENKNDWLSDLNIDLVMEQEERKFEDFFYLGSVPIDFYEINYQDIAKINFDDIMKKGNVKKNIMMRKYNIKQLYYDNILLFNEINKFLGKKKFYNFINFKKDIKKYTEGELNKLMKEFNEQFNKSKYDDGLIKLVKNDYPNFPNDLTNNILNILNKEYPIKKIGMIPNLDEHWKGGSHWIGLYANLENGDIYYYDSYGYRPNKRMRSYIKLIAEWKYKKDTGKTVNIKEEDYMKGANGEKNEIEQKYDIRYSEIRNQFGGSECGVYSMNFIIRLLNGTKFDDIVRERLPDEMVNTCREIYFHNQDIVTDKMKGRGGSKCE